MRRRAGAAARCGTWRHEAAGYAAYQSLTRPRCLRHAGAAGPGGRSCRRSRASRASVRRRAARTVRGRPVCMSRRRGGGGERERERERVCAGAQRVRVQRVGARAAAAQHLGVEAVHARGVGVDRNAVPAPQVGKLQPPVRQPTVRFGLTSKRVRDTHTHTGRWMRPSGAACTDGGGGRRQRTAHRGALLQATLKVGALVGFELFHGGLEGRNLRGDQAPGATKGSKGGSRHATAARRAESQYRGPRVKRPRSEAP